MAMIDQQSNAEPLPSVLTVAHVVYALHTFAIVVGIVGAATVIGSFVGSLPSIVAVILNYVKRSRLLQNRGPSIEGMISANWKFLLTL